MNPEKINHIALRAALAGALTPTKGSEQPSPDEMAQRVWQWAESSFPLNPTLSLPDGFPVGASLLRDPKVSFCRGFFESWKEKYGVQALFSQGNPSVSQLWVARLVDALNSDLSYSATDSAQVLAWVLPNAPEGQLDQDLARQAFEVLEADRRKKHPLSADLSDALSGHFERILGSALDPLRPPIRWSANAEDLNKGADLSMPVRLPSGKVRPLEEWVRLRSPSHLFLEVPGEKHSLLPDPPHGRRQELARDWVLDPKISLDEARARMWSATAKNPSSLWTLLEWLQEPPRKSPDYPERLAKLFNARDALGRSFLAFLTTHRAGDSEDREGISRYLLEHEVVPASLIYGEDGSGLVEQVFQARRLGQPKDALGGGLRPPEGWVTELYGGDVYQGPEDRRSNLEDDLADSLLTGSGYSWTSLQGLGNLLPSEKIRQAHLWGKVNQRLSTKLEVYNLPKSRAREVTATACEVLRTSIESLVESIESNPGLLWIGEIEFAQFKSMLYAPILERSSLVPQEFLDIAHRGLEKLDRAVVFNSMHLEIDEAPAAASPRPRF